MLQVLDDHTARLRTSVESATNWQKSLSKTGPQSGSGCAKHAAWEWGCAILSALLATWQLWWSPSSLANLKSPTPTHTTTTTTTTITTATTNRSVPLRSSSPPPSSSYTTPHPNQPQIIPDHSPPHPQILATRNFVHMGTRSIVPQYPHQRSFRLLQRTHNKNLLFIFIFLSFFFSVFIFLFFFFFFFIFVFFFSFLILLSMIAFPFSMQKMILIIAKAQSREFRCYPEFLRGWRH